MQKSHLLQLERRDNAYVLAKTSVTVEANSMVIGKVRIDSRSKFHGGRATWERCSRTKGPTFSKHAPIRHSPQLNLHAVLYFQSIPIL